jgi:hypothetical protein
MIMTSVRTGGFARSHRRPSRIGCAGRGIRRVAIRDRRAGDACDEHDGQCHADDLGDERPERSHREQERAQRRTGELVRHQIAGLKSGVAETEIRGTHEHGQQRAAGRVGEHLRRSVQERGHQHDPHAHGAGHEEHDQAGDDEGAQGVRDDDEPAAVVMVGHRPREQAEEQPWQVLHHGTAGYEDRRTRERGDEQRGCRQGDPVAEVARPGRAQQPAEVTPEAAGSDDLADGTGRSATGTTPS